MSLSTAKAKEGKGKKNLLPKLRTILANPIIKKSPTLDETELDDLKNILQKSISNSEMEPKRYVSCKRIHLGLESSLRAINNQQSSCVFISLSIKPNHIVTLISRNAEVKDETQPIYAQPRLEDFTEKIFGIRALCLVLPKDLKAISDDLFNWVEKRRRPTYCKVREIVSSKTRNKLKIKKVQKNLKPTNIAIGEEEVNKLNTIACDVDNSTEAKQSWKGDYISFKGDNVAMSEIQLGDSNSALESLTRIMDRVPNIPLKVAEEQKHVAMDVDEHAVTLKLCDQQTESEESIDFLDEYKPLVLHKIKPNPNKKPKKKRNKKNKQIKK